MSTLRFTKRQQAVQQSQQRKQKQSQKVATLLTTAEHKKLNSDKNVSGSYRLSLDAESRKQLYPDYMVKEEDGLRTVGNASAEGSQDNNYQPRHYLLQSGQMKNLYEQSTSTLVDTSEGVNLKGRRGSSETQGHVTAGINWKKIMLNQQIAEVQHVDSQKTSARDKMHKTVTASIVSKNNLRVSTQEQQIKSPVGKSRGADTDMLQRSREELSLVVGNSNNKEEPIETILSKTPSVVKEGMMTHREFSNKKVVQQFDKAIDIVDYDDRQTRKKMISKLHVPANQRSVSQTVEISQESHESHESKTVKLKGKQPTSVDIREKQYNLLLLAERKIKSELNRRKKNSSQGYGSQKDVRASASQGSTDSAGNRLGESAIQQAMTEAGLNPEQSVMSENVFMSNFQNQDRPFGWRESNKFNESSMVQDYQFRYKLEAANNKDTMNKTAQMGPFYEKYIKKLGQMFVKDRVKRLKQTFEVARSGQLTNLRASYVQQFSQSANESDQMERSFQNVKGSMDYQASQGDYLNNSQETVPQERRRRSTDLETPLMTKSGFDLRQRLGFGDKTVDQLFPKANSLAQMNLGQMRQGQAELMNSDLRIEPKRSVLSTYGNKAIKINDVLRQKRNSNSSIDGTSQNEDLINNEFRLEENPSRLQHELPTHNISINLGNANSPSRTEAQMFPVTMDADLNSPKHNNNGNKANGMPTRSPIADKSILLPHQDSIVSNDQNQASLQSLLIKPQQPTVQVKGTLNQENTESKGATTNKKHPSVVHMGDSSLYQSVSQQKETNKSVIQFDLNLSQLKALQVKSHNRDSFKEKEIIPTPNTKQLLQNHKIKQKQWNRQKIMQEKLPQRDFKLGTHRNKLQKHVWKQPTMHNDSTHQLVDETLDQFYSQASKDQSQTTKETFQFKRTRRVPPIDYAAVKSKAFQQFDFIMDATKELEKKIVSRNQIQYSHEEDSPRDPPDERLYRYSKKPPTELVFVGKRPNITSESVTQMDHHKNATLSVQESLNLSQLKTAQVTRDRKICKSCLPGVVKMHNRQAVRVKSNLSEKDQDWLRGCYHSKLASNLQITQDFVTADNRTKRELSLVQNDYVESQNVSPASKPKKKKNIKKLQKPVPQAIDSDRTNLYEQTVRDLAAMFKQERSDAVATPNTEEIDKRENYRNYISNQNSLAQLSSQGETEVGLSTSMIVLDAKGTNKNLKKNQVSAQTSPLDTSATHDREFMKPAGSHPNVGAHFPQKKGTITIKEQKLDFKVPVLGQPRPSSDLYIQQESSLYSIDQKISFLEPEISQKLVDLSRGNTADSNQIIGLQTTKTEERLKEMERQKLQTAPKPLEQYQKIDNQENPSLEKTKMQSGVPGTTENIYNTKNAEPPSDYHSGRQQSAEVRVQKSSSQSRQPLIDPSESNMMSETRSLFHQPKYYSRKSTLSKGSHEGPIQRDEFQNAKFLPKLPQIQRSQVNLRTLKESKQENHGSKASLGSRKSSVPSRKQMILHQNHVQRPYEPFQDSSDSQLHHSYDHTTNTMHISHNIIPQNLRTSIAHRKGKKNQVSINRHLQGRHDRARKWVSPFQAHQEHALAKKQMLEFMISSQPAEKSRQQHETIEEIPEELLQSANFKKGVIFQYHSTGGRNSRDGSRNSPQKIHASGHKIFESPRRSESHLQMMKGTLMLQQQSQSDIFRAQRRSANDQEDDSIQRKTNPAAMQKSQMNASCSNQTGSIDGAKYDSASITSNQKLNATMPQELAAGPSIDESGLQTIKPSTQHLNPTSYQPTDRRQDKAIGTDNQESTPGMRIEERNSIATPELNQVKRVR